MSSPKPPSTRSPLVAWVLPIGVNVVLPVLTYVVLTGAGTADVPALLLSGVWPLIDLLVTLRLQGQVDEFAVFVIIGLVAGIIAALFSGSTRAVFLKDSVASIVIGVAFLVSLPGKPLTFFLARRFATDGSRAQREWWDGLWAHARFRLVQRRLGAAWGVALIAESVLRAVLTYRLGATSMVVVNNVLPYAVIAAMIALSVTVGRRERERAERLGHGGAAPPAAA